ncbi:LOW QUALITY PROTEIN: uncharacterized protein [Hetaerina americana]|uniref:LOW QUALITY PROTEIN: uncharacterized protein n=1 Tax=Hetaerina americana TaxID=62018 RepID=UPI003A7F4C42
MHVGSEGGETGTSVGDVGRGGAGGRAGGGRCSTFLYYTWKICSCIFSHVVLVSLVVAYCILGAFTFESLEAEHERDVKRGISRVRDNVTDDLWRLTRNTLVLHRENWTSAVVDRLRSFEAELLLAMKRDGWDGSEDLNSIQWTFAGALFYSIIVITTIGYGHIAPKTHWGKVVTIFYAILGIPLMLLCLSNIGDIMAHSFRFLYWKVCCYMCTRRPRRQHRRGRCGQEATVLLRSVRQLGGRWSSRTAPPRSSARESQRSADSALGSLLDRPTYSDTECSRYYDDPDVAAAVGSSLQRNRASQHSRGSDTVIAMAHSQQQLQGAAGGPPVSGPEAPRTPVLFNKYAMEKEHRGVVPEGPYQPGVAEPGVLAPTGGGSLRRTAHRGPGDPGPVGGPYSHHHPSTAYPGPPLRSFSARSAGASSASRLSRLREDYLMDELDYEVEEEEFAGAGGSSGDGRGGGRAGDRTRPVPIWLCVFLVVSYIFGGAFLFSEWEKWPFLDSAYFCFITLTTIGFGDFVPAQRVKDNAEVSIALCSLYLLFGIALLAMSFNLVQEEVISSVKSVAKRLGIIKEEEDEDDD